jgi:hypothetical protein
MLDDLRKLMRQDGSQRARLYGLSAGAVALAMSLFDVDLAAQGGAPLWLAFSAGVLALISRALVSGTAEPASPEPAAPIPMRATAEQRHERDLATRNLNARAS